MSSVTQAQQEDFYAVLGIAATATAEEIRTAYYRSVRKHPPEKDAEGFKRIQNAYDVLSQPATRKEYDETSRTDPQTRELVDRGRKLLDEGDADAVPLIKRALVRQPESVLIRDLLTQALMVAEEFHEALTQARKVLALEPNNPVYSVRVGDALRALDRDEEALPYYRKAVYLDRSSSQFLVKLAYLLNYLEKPDDAIKLVEAAVLGDGKVDFDDFIYFQCLCTIYTLEERYTELEATHRRIKEILPPDPDTRSYVAWFYFVHALRMAQGGNFEGAVRSIEEAASLDSSLPELEETAQRLREARAALRELEALQHDETFDGALRMALISLGYRRILGEQKIFEEAFENSTQQLQRVVSTQGIDIPAQIRTLRRKYKALAELVDDLLDNIEEVAASAPKIYLSLTCPSCGARGHTDRPTIQTLMADGMSASDARTVYQNLGEQGILRNTTFTCSKCGIRFNGLSQPATSTPDPISSPASGSSGCFVVTAACGEETAYPVRVLRGYRDRRLAATFWGRALIRVYAVVGPRLARIVARFEAVRLPALAVCEWLARRLDRG